MFSTSPLTSPVHTFRVRSFFADLQSILCCFVHVKITDGVLQAGLCASLWDRFGNGVHVELSDFWVVVNLGAWPWHLPELFILFQMTARMTKNPQDNIKIPEVAELSIKQLC